MNANRIIGRLNCTKKGVLFIAIGGIHGNEQAGVTAIANVFKKLRERECLAAKGSFVGVVGNLRAGEQSLRYLKKDLNRQWDAANVSRLSSKQETVMDEEDLEVRELLEQINDELKREKPERLLILDLHTTSADGGVFALVDDQTESLPFAMRLERPIIRGMNKVLKGTTLDYFNSRNFQIPTSTIAFEAGQHNDSAAISECERAIFKLLEFCEIIDDTPSNAAAEQIGLSSPLLAEISYTHHISAEDHFSMKPGYLNFQEIRSGEILATDKNGEITAPYDCRVLMPLYQEQGNEGFFLIKEVAWQGT